MIKRLIVLSAADKKAGTSDDWFHNLSDDQQKRYVDEHPDSKYSKMHKQDHKEKKQDEKNKKQRDKQDGVKKPIHKKVAHSVKQFKKDQNEFFRGKENEAGSDTRRSMGKFMKDKAGGVIKALKQEGEHWKHSVGAVKKLAKGEKLDKHDKSALKNVAFSIASTVIPMAITGGLSAGIAHAAPHLATHLLKDSLVMSGLRAAAFASVVTAGDISDEEAESKLDEIMKGMGTAMEKSDIPKEQWQGAFDKANEGIDTPKTEPATKTKPIKQKAIENYQTEDN